MIKNARDRTLDRLFETLYEDNISGKITDERFAKMSQKYEFEQAELKEKLTIKQKQLDEMTEKAQTIETFLTAVRRYTR
ncbi:MAG: recombinase, partial [Oscillospiraceae bacterium]